MKTKLAVTVFCGTLILYGLIGLATTTRPDYSHDAYQIEVQNEYDIASNITLEQAKYFSMWLKNSQYGEKMPTGFYALMCAHTRACLPQFKSQIANYENCTEILNHVFQCETIPLVRENEKQ